MGEEEINITNVYKKINRKIWNEMILIYSVLILFIINILEDMRELWNYIKNHKELIVVNLDI